MVAPNSLPEEALPGLYQAADKASLQAQRRFIRASAARLFCVIGAAILATISLKTANRIDLAAIGVAVLFVVAVLIELWLLQDKPLDTWYNGRALAESAKTLAWRYAVGARPFPITLDDADRGLLEDVRGLINDAPDTAIEASDSPVISDKMRRLRGLQLTDRKTAYVLWRLDDQRAWYRRKARWNASRAKNWRLVLIGLELAGVGAALIKGLGLVDLDLAGIVAAIIAAGAAWLAIKQHDSLARAYALASEELAVAREGLMEIEDEGSWASEAADAEEGISREHTMWRASRCSTPFSRRLGSRETRWHPGVSEQQR